MRNSRKITINCAAETADGDRCERTLTVPLYQKFWDHYCHLHRETGD